jgi:hypothetical protein
MGRDHLYVVDQLANPEAGSGGIGSVWRINESRQVSLWAVSSYFRRLGGIVVPTDGRPLLGDLDATVGAGLPGGGAIFRWSDRDAAGARFYPLATNNLFLHPQGMVLFQDATPIVALLFESASSESGIELRWEGLADPEDAVYLLYRRLAEGPDDTGEEDDYPSGYELLVTDGEFRGRGPHRTVDAGVDPGAWYVYRIAIVYRDGSTDYTPPLSVRAPEDLLRFALGAARPNPFRGTVSLTFSIPRTGPVRLSIHDVSGRRVRDLVDEGLAPGRYPIVWDGRDQAGRRSPSGVYFARLQQHAQVQTQRLVLVR